MSRISRLSSSGDQRERTFPDSGMKPCERRGRLGGGGLLSRVAVVMVVLAGAVAAGGEGIGGVFPRCGSVAGWPVSSMRRRLC